MSDLRKRVRALVDARGVDRAARALGLTKEPVLRFCAGLEVRAGTIALVERNIDAAEKGEAADG